MNSGVGRAFVRGIVGVLSVVLVSTLVPARSGQAKSRPIVPRELFGMHYHGVSNSIPGFRVGCCAPLGQRRDLGGPPADPGRHQLGSPRCRGRTTPSGRDRRDPVRVRPYAGQWAAAQPEPGRPYRQRVCVRAGEHGLLHQLRAALLPSATAGGSRPTTCGMRPTSRSSWTGPSKQLAQLTIEGSRAIKSVDPGAKVLAPSITYGVFTPRPQLLEGVRLADEEGTLADRRGQRPPVLQDPQLPDQARQDDHQDQVVLPQVRLQGSDLGHRGQLRRPSWAGPAASSRSSTAGMSLPG